ncbi:MAG: SpoIID/LytB domain-containing protein [Clostridium sp.]|nr:SpoIID/LytB domain-containing protein [Clostridium sp.]
MNKITKRLAAALLAAVMLLPTTAMAATYNDDGDIMVRVGLASGSKHNALGQLACAHLQNAEDYGSGFRFGYYDEDLNFEELADTDEDIAQIAVVKTQNLCYGYDSEQGRTTYSPNVQSDIKIGCFHIMIDTYSTLKKARNAAEDYDDSFVAWIDGEYQVRVGSWFTKEEAQAALDELGEGEIVGTSAYGMSVVETGTDHILFQYDEGGGSRLAILPDVTEEEDVQTWFRGYKYRGGFTYQRISGGSLTVVNVLPLEDYVKGVAPYEMGREWPVEALKTQATCARTYVMINLGKHEDLGFDVCNSSWCQVYYGTGSGRTDFGPTKTSDEAVEETAGQVVWYGTELAETYYSSSHGGASESIANVWGSKLSKYPYLCGVEDPHEQGADDINANSSWTVSYTKSNLAKKLQSSGYGVGTSLDYLELTYSELGNVIKLTVHWTNGGKNTFKPDDIRSVFGLKSIRFVVNDTRVEGTQEEEQKPTGSDFLLNEKKTITFGELFDEEIYVITGDGEVELVDDKPYVITGGGEKSLLIEPVEDDEKNDASSKAGTVTVSGSKFVFEGGGWGHQLGMSQYGAYAMAKDGYDYDEIIEFYFPGTHVDDYED